MLLHLAVQTWTITTAQVGYVTCRENMGNVHPDQAQLIQHEVDKKEGHNNNNLLC